MDTIVLKKNEKTDYYVVGKPDNHIDGPCGCEGPCGCGCGKPGHNNLLWRGTTTTAWGHEFFMAERALTIWVPRQEIPGCIAWDESRNAYIDFDKAVEVEKNYDDLL